MGNPGVCEGVNRVNSEDSFGPKIRYTSKQQTSEIGRFALGLLLVGALGPCKKNVEDVTTTPTYSGNRPVNDRIYARMQKY